MAHPFGDQDQGPGGAAKRPAQTIEGKATEVKVEPAVGEEAASASASASASQSEAEAGAAHSAGDAVPGAETKSPPPRPGRVKSFFTHCLAGLVGGLIGVGALALAWSGLDFGKEATPAPEIAALEQRVAKLETAPAPSADAEALSKLDQRVAALEGSNTEISPNLSALAERVAQLETSLKTLAETASEGGSVGSAAAIVEQIKEAEKRLDAKIAAALAQGEEANAAAIAGLKSELAELKAKLSALAEAELGGGDSPELTALEQRLAKLEAAIDQEVGGAKAAAVAIAFANLRAAVSDGRPFAAELDTIGALAPQVGDFGVLPAYAESGIPTVPALARSFAAAEDDALKTAAPAADGSLVDHLMASAQALVKIKRIDEAPAGEGLAATLARARGALDRGDLASAVNEVESLEAPVREAFSAWLGEAHARLGADETLTRLEGVLLVSMGGDAQTTQP